MAFTSCVHSKKTKREKRKKERKRKNREKRSKHALEARAESRGQGCGLLVRQVV